MVFVNLVVTPNEYIVTQADPDTRACLECHPQDPHFSHCDPQDHPFLIVTLVLRPVTHSIALALYLAKKKKRTSTHFLGWVLGSGSEVLAKHNSFRVFTLLNPVQHPPTYRV